MLGGHRGLAARVPASSASPAGFRRESPPITTTRALSLPLLRSHTSATRRRAGQIPVLKATTSRSTTQAAPAKTADQGAENAPSSPAADAGDADGDAGAAQATTPTTWTPPTPLPTDLPPVDFDDVVLVQTFGWTSHKPVDGASFWTRLAAQAPQIAALGATHAWLPPPSASVSPEGYLPGQLYDLNSAYGSPRELKECVESLKRAGVRAQADVVINHRCADKQDENGTWNVYEDTGADDNTIDEGDGGRATVRWDQVRGLFCFCLSFRSLSLDRPSRRRPSSRSLRSLSLEPTNSPCPRPNALFIPRHTIKTTNPKWAITGDDPTFGGQGNPDSGADFEGAPDLDHHNPQLRRALVDWLSWLREDFGFESWRLDFAKGYAAPYAGCYCMRTLPAGYFAVGELWCDLRWTDEGKPAENQDAARQAICDWLDGVRAGGGDAAAFDFVTKGILQSALASGELWRLRDASGKPPGLAGWWPQRAVLFVDNHDTGSAQAHWPCRPDCVAAAYAYVLTHPGIPCLFAEHCLDPAAPDGSPVRSAIEALVKLRRDAGVGASSTLNIREAARDLYVADVRGARLEVRVKLGGAMDMGRWLPSGEEGWELRVSGQWFAVWARDLSSGEAEEEEEAPSSPPAAR